MLHTACVSGCLPAMQQQFDGWLAHPPWGCWGPPTALMMRGMLSHHLPPRLQQDGQGIRTLSEVTHTCACKLWSTDLPLVDFNRIPAPALPRSLPFL